MRGEDWGQGRRQFCEAPQRPKDPTQVGIPLGYLGIVPGGTTAFTPGPGRLLEMHQVRTPLGPKSPPEVQEEVQKGPLGHVPHPELTLGLP